MVQCPYCSKGKMKIKKEWDYASFHVKAYVCESCSKSVRAYYQENKLSHTIPKKMQDKFKK